MPQIAVTIDDDVYLDLIHNLPKGLKSKFVNRAVKKAILVCGGFGNVMHAYARQGEHVAHEVYNTTLEAHQAARNANQMKIDIVEEDVVEEIVETENEKWIREQKEANE